MYVCLSVSVCMYVCKYVCMYVCMYESIYSLLRYDEMHEPFCDDGMTVTGAVAALQVSFASIVGLFVYCRSLLSL